MRLVFTIIFLFLMVFFMVFAWQNQNEQVHVVFGSWDSGSLPLFLLILLAFGGGVIITSIIGIIEGMRIRMTNLKLRRKLKRLEGEVDSLRNLPLGNPLAVVPDPGTPGADDDVL
ncbi:MAG TPA: lipopolysaccharide assembly protein LapA domain-containing protein [Verrucomicrobiae bacterium]|nr:lipopolysaccharide assembly protein LapA domain-containing protein [Verrucomicrobiae bacterium]